MSDHRARVWTDRRGRRQLALSGVDLDSLTGEDTPPSGPHEPATEAERRLMAQIRELERQLHEARQEIQGLRDASTDGQ